MNAPKAPLEQIEWRVDSEPYDRNGGTVCRFVPYLNAPIIAAMLDEWVGPDGWSDSYEVGMLGGREVLWCRLTIGDVTKMDVGMPSNTEAQKGQVSDAFKRAACLKWGVGRNVYELPTLFAKCGERKKGDKRIAVASKETLPDLLRQLKELGFDASGGKLEDAEPEDRAGGEAGDLPPTAPPAPSPDDLPPVDTMQLVIDAMTAKDLHDELEKRGLESSGTKPELRDRLRAAVAA